MNYIYFLLLRPLLFLRVLFCWNFCALYNKNGNNAVFKAETTPDPPRLLRPLLLVLRLRLLLLLLVLLLAIIY